MPFINSKVSCKITKQQEISLKEKLGKAIQLIGKSESWLMIGFEDERSIYFKGEACEKVAFIEVKLFGSASNSAYDQLTKAICDIFENELGIPQNKIYVKYEEVSHWGYNGSNF